MLFSCPFLFQLSLRVQVLPNMVSVADIKATFYDVCGVVQTIGDGYKTKVKNYILQFNLVL